MKGRRIVRENLSVRLPWQRHNIAFNLLSHFICPAYANYDCHSRSLTEFFEINTFYNNDTTDWKHLVLPPCHRLCGFCNKMEWPSIFCKHHFILQPSKMSKSPIANYVFGLEKLYYNKITKVFLCSSALARRLSVLSKHIHGRVQRVLKFNNINRSLWYPIFFRDVGLPTICLNVWEY